MEEWHKRGEALLENILQILSDWGKTSEVQRRSSSVHWKILSIFFMFFSNIKLFHVYFWSFLMVFWSLIWKMQMESSLTRMQFQPYSKYSCQKRAQVFLLINKNDYFKILYWFCIHYKPKIIYQMLLICQQKSTFYLWLFWYICCFPNELWWW